MSNAPGLAPGIFTTHVYVEPSYLTAISKYRSVAGHPFSDNYEKPERSLKNYFEPRRSLLGKPPSIPVYAPATGTIFAVTPEGNLLASGQPRGYQISLSPDGYPAFEIRLFHVAVAPTVRAGMHVTAGDALGFANVQEGIDFDWAVGAMWNAPPLYDMNGGNQVPKAPGYRLVSPFDVMNDETFANYAPYGVTDRSAFVVPLAYRETHPTAASGGDLSNFDDVEFVTLQPPEGPVIDFQPLSLHTQLGGTIYFSASASFYFGPPLRYLWKRNGVPFDVSVASSREPLFFVQNAKASDMGFYSVTVTGSGISTESAVAILTVDDFTSSRLINVSTRGLVPAGGVLTPGFVLRGSGTKPLLIRAVGPTLGNSFGVAGVLADPKMDLIELGRVNALLSNDNWDRSSALETATVANGTFPLAVGSKDAAVLTSLASAGRTGYSVRIAASGAAISGVALAEVYDPEPLTAPVRLVNVSTLGFAGVAAEGLTPGFVIGGTAPKQVLVRAIGPGLAPFGVVGALADPRLTITPLGKTFTIASNNDWGDDGRAPAVQAAILAAGAFQLAPGSQDAALVVRLPPGGYTVQVRGAGGTTGYVLVEVYDLDP
ncbi:MAG: hypothetical protein EXS32_11275 [Opitutus sp.]|nr:hypothetical protein [Opitutus sp.]